MRLLTVIESLGRGGAEQALVNLLPTLQSHGIECEVAALWEPTDIAEDLRHKGIKVHRLNIKHRWQMGEALLKLNSLLRRHHYDIIHSHLMFANLYVGLSRHFIRAPKRITTFHCVDFEFETRIPMYGKFRDAIFKNQIKHGFDAYGAVSLDVAEHYEKFVNIQKIEVIPNAFPVDSLRPRNDLDRSEILGQYGITPSDFLFALSARLAPQKNHPLLFQAVQKLQTSGLFPKVMLIGDGPSRNDLETEAKKRGIDRQVIFCGRQPHDRLLNMVQLADAFVLSSNQEGFPLAPAEAMALERPVLSTRVSGLTDLIEDQVSGMLVPPNDVDALANGMVRFMQDADLCRYLGENGRKRITENFSSEHIASRWINVYKHRDVKLA